MTKRFIVAIGMMVLLGVGGCAGSGETGDTSAPDRGPDQAPKQGKRFLNPYVSGEHASLAGFFRARFRSGPWAKYDPETYEVPMRKPSLATTADVGQMVATWVGHSTVLLQYRGINVITDPIFSKRASPLSFVGPKRYTRPAIELADLPPIDVVVISHDHYDHLDKRTIRRLGDRPYYLVPLGLKRWLVGEGVSADRVTELDWWQSQTVQVGDQQLTLTATPTQHFSGRGLFNRDQTLWASWVIAWSDFTAWFGGDTGYNDVQFKDIGRRTRNIDLGIIPIGAYAPRWFVSTVHVDPAQALSIHKDIGAKRSFGVHWGAFLLTAEPVHEPAQLLAEELAAHGMAPDEFRSFAIGESVRYPVVDALQVPAKLD